MDVGLWLRWAAMHGVPRAYMKLRARRGDPLARLIAGHGRSFDPYPLMDDIRAQGPLVRLPFTWVSADHSVCRVILRDKRFGVTAPSSMDLPRPLRTLIERTDPAVANPVEPPAMVIVDPPDHTRYRQLVAQSFTPRAIDRLGALVVDVTRDSIEHLAGAAQPDLIGDFAARLPVAIIAEILDLPADMRARVLDWGHSGAPLLDIGIGWRTYRDAIAGLRGADADLKKRFEELRAGAHSDSPFSRLAADGSLTEHELTANAALLVGAGFETTVNLIGNGIALLLSHPGQLALLRDEPHRWPNAVEEVLRFDSPVQMTARTALSDLEIAGQRIAAGDMVALLLSGANRDPAVFADPGRFDISRDNAREHLAFASGIHACIGAALARIEGVTALRALFETFPELQLSAPPQPRGLVNLRGYQWMPARLGSRHRIPAGSG
jgi:cytochrome P450